MFNLESVVQSVLDAFGIHLDEDSFNNLMGLLPFGSLNMFQRTMLAAGLGVVATLIRKWLNDRQARQAVTAPAVTA